MKFQALLNLCTIQKHMGLPQLKLEQDVLTKWNSSFHMLHKIKGAAVSLMTLLYHDQDHMITQS